MRLTPYLVSAILAVPLSVMSLPLSASPTDVSILSTEDPHFQYSSSRLQDAAASPDPRISRIETKLTLAKRNPKSELSVADMGTARQLALHIRVMGNPEISPELLKSTTEAHARLLRGDTGIFHRLAPALKEMHKRNPFNQWGAEYLGTKGVILDS